MITKRRLPLMVKVAAWLAIHLLAIAAAFALFVGWQLRLGLDSLLSGATGERLGSLGKEISQSLSKTSPEKWDSIISDKISPYELKGYFRIDRDLGQQSTETEIPSDIITRALKELPRPDVGRREPPDMFRHNPRHRPDEPHPLVRSRPRDEPKTRSLFLTKDETNGKYWAAIELFIETPGRFRPTHGVLFLQSNNASARGLFFDYSPWLYGGLAVLVLSIALWTPFVLSITRYAGRISKATQRIADGHFDTKLGASRNDELGRAGESIEEMSARLGHLISGQKRFLGDVAHELCAPLARMRTGLGILQNNADAQQLARIDSIEEDAEELSSLVSELLDFTKASSSPAKPETILLAEFCQNLATRELVDHTYEIDIPETLSIKADRQLLTRALRNVLRNCHLHAGPQCSVKISATTPGNSVNLAIEDNGPGAPEKELSRLFEPFYRLDRSRNRETGGTGLGMTIVDSSVRACNGKVSAEQSPMGGLLVRFILPKS